jgi:hypothetical protein
LVDPVDDYAYFAENPMYFKIDFSEYYVIRMLINGVYIHSHGVYAISIALQSFKYRKSEIKKIGCVKHVFENKYINFTELSLCYFKR